LAYRSVSGGGGGSSGHTGALVGAPSTYSRFAPGCSGSNTASTLVPIDTPEVGKTFSVGLDQVPADAAVMVTGFSLIGVPVDLSALGMPGCLLQVPPDMIDIVVGSSHHATCSLTVPNDIWLRGFTFYQQALVLDPGAGNPMGAVMSTAAIARIGGAI